MYRFLLVPSRLTLLAAALVALTSVLVPAPVAVSAAEPAAQRKVTAWIPYWDQPRAMRSFTENADLYGYVSPFWYVMNVDGTVGRYPGAEDAQVLEGVRATGVPLVPTITNAFDAARTSAVLRSEPSRAAHVLAILALVETQGYDGIDVDYESMAAADRDVFSAFLRELAAPLHARGKLLTVAVHPKTSEPGTWSGPQSHDYAAIGAVADRVRVMAYGYSWSTSPAGPIAPLPWVRSLAAFTTSRIPARKVELGMNLYGRDWVGSAGTALTYDGVSALMTRHGASRVWDASAAEPSFSYLDGGTSHTVHYADAESVGHRLAVVDEYALAGAAFWRLGGEDPKVWQAVRARWGTATQPAPGPSPEAAPTPEAAPVAAPKAPPVPGRLSLRVTGRSGSLTWAAAPTAAGGYRVLRSTTSQGPWVTVAEVSGTRFTDRLPRGRRAWYAVQPVDASGLVGPVSSAVRAGGR